MRLHSTAACGPQCGARRLRSHRAAPGDELDACPGETVHPLAGREHRPGRRAGRGSVASPRARPTCPRSPFLCDDHPCNLVTVRKSEQTGASILALAWTLFIADREPANILYAAPTLDMLRDLNSGKLQPMIDAWQRRTGRVVVEPATSRSAAAPRLTKSVPPRTRSGSPTRTPRRAVGENDQEGRQGRIIEMEDAGNRGGSGDAVLRPLHRLPALRRVQNPRDTDAGSRLFPACMASIRPIAASIAPSGASDQRFWNVPCPQCRELFVHDIKFFRPERGEPARQRLCVPGLRFTRSVTPNRRR